MPPITELPSRALLTLKPLIFPVGARRRQPEVLNDQRERLIVSTREECSSWPAIGSGLTGWEQIGTHSSSAGLLRGVQPLVRFDRSGPCLPPSQFPTRSAVFFHSVGVFCSPSAQ